MSDGCPYQQDQYVDPHTGTHITLWRWDQENASAGLSQYVVSGKFLGRVHNFMAKEGADMAGRYFCYYSTGEGSAYSGYSIAYATHLPFLSV